jgi:hypothetical protein
VSGSGRALAVAGAVLAGLLGAAFLAFGFVPSFAALTGGFLGKTASGLAGRAFWSGLGTAVLAADVAVVLRSLGFGASKVIEFESGAGRMAVDVSALEECLRRTALEDPDVTDASCSLRVPAASARRPIVCDVVAGVYERADVPGKGRKIASNLRRRFLQIVPVEVDPVVNLDIRIRPPRPGTEAATATQEMSAAGGESEEDERLPEVHEFTGERRYVVPGERDAG